MQISFVRRVSVFLGILGAVFVGTPFVYGAPTMAVQLQNPLGNLTTLPQLIEQILKVAIQIGFPLLVLMIVYTGFLFIKAQGKQKELTDAKKAFTWTIVGGAILLGALAIAQLLNSTITTIGAGV